MQARKFGLLASLYVSQGLPFGFFTQALPVVMREQHFSLQWIGLGNLLALPWALKWAWAPWVDRVYSVRWGRRRSWLVPLQLLGVLSAIGLASLPLQHALLGLVIGCLLTSAIAATQDVATDGLAVELLEPSERAWGNGVQVGGYRLGMIIGGGGLLVAFERWGWSWAQLTMALSLLLLSVPILRHVEGAAPTEASVALPTWSFLRRPGVWRWLLVLAAYKTGDAFATGMLRPFLVDSGLSLSKIGVLVGTVGSLASLFGAWLGGRVTRVLGVRTSLALFGALTSVCLLGYLTAASLGVGPTRFTWYVLVAAEHVVSSMATVALFTEMMSHCRVGAEGGDYTLQASVVVVCTGLAAALSGFSAARLGYPLHFLLGALAALAGAALALLGTQRHSQVRPAP